MRVRVALVRPLRRELRRPGRQVAADGSRPQLLFEHVAPQIRLLVDERRPEDVVGVDGSKRGAVLDALPERPSARSLLQVAPRELAPPQPREERGVQGVRGRVPANSARSPRFRRWTDPAVRRALDREPAVRWTEPAVQRRENQPKRARRLARGFRRGRRYDASSGPQSQASNMLACSLVSPWSSTRSKARKRSSRCAEQISSANLRS